MVNNLQDWTLLLSLIQWFSYSWNLLSLQVILQLFFNWNKLWLTLSNKFEPTGVLWTPVNINFNLAKSTFNFQCYSKQYCSTGDLWLCGFGNVTFAGVKGLHYKVYNSMCNTSCHTSSYNSCNSCNNSSSRSSTNNNDNDNNKHGDGKYHFEHIGRAGLSGWARGHGGGGVHHGQALGPARVGRHHHCPLHFRRDRWLGQVTLTTFRYIFVRSLCKMFFPHQSEGNWRGSRSQRVDPMSPAHREYGRRFSLVVRNGEPSYTKYGSMAIFNDQFIKRLIHIVWISNCEISNLEEQQKLSMLKMSTNDSEKIGLKDTCHVFSCLLFRCKPNPQIVHIWKMHKKLWLVKVLIGAYQDTEDCRERPDTIGFVLTVITLTLRWNRRRTFN